MPTGTMIGRALNAGLRLPQILLLAALLTLAACDTPEERAQKHYDKGIAFIEAGEREKAIVEFKNAVKLAPEFTEGYLELGKAILKEGDYPGAVATLGKVTELDPVNVEAHLNLGQLMLQAGQLDEAKSHADAAVAAAPQDAGVVTLKAAVSLAVGDIAGARKQAQEALSFDTGYSEARMVLAAASLQAGEIEVALGELDVALIEDERNVALNVFRINLLERMGENERVGEVLERLITFYPEALEYRRALVQWRLSQGDVDGAEAEIRKVAEIGDDQTSRMDVVRFMAARRGVDQARGELTRMIDAAGTDEEKWALQLAFADLETANDEMDKAMALLDQVLAAASGAPSEALARIRKARIHLVRNERDDANSEIELVLGAEPDNDSALAVRARIRILEDRYDEAIQDLRSALNQDPDSTEFLTLLATAHARNGSMGLAGDRLASAAQASDYAADPVIRYARHLLEVGKSASAEGVLEEGIWRNSRDTRLLTLLGQVRLQRGDWVGAEKIAEVLQKIEQEGDSASRLLAASLSGQQRFDDSIRVLRSAYANSGGAVTNMAALVRTYQRAGQTEAARQFLNDLLAENPANTEARILIGGLDRLAGDDASAETAYREAIANAPSNESGYAALGSMLARSQRLDEADTVTREGRENVPESDNLRLAHALILEVRGEVDEAIEIYEGLYETRPSSLLIANNLASLLSDHREDPESIERAYNVAKRLQASETPEFQDTYGWTLYRRGDFEGAVRILKPAHDALPSNPVVGLHLGMAYAKSNQAELARPLLEEAVENGLADAAEVEQTLKAAQPVQPTQ